MVNVTHLPCGDFKFVNKFCCFFVIYVLITFEKHDVLEFLENIQTNYLLDGVVILISTIIFNQPV